MKWFQNLPFRSKLYVAILLTVLIVVLGITATMTLTASRQAVDSNRATLNLLTEQALINFAAEAENTSRNIYSLCNSTNTAEQMNLMRNMTPGDIGYLLARRDLTQAVARMIISSTPYGHASVLLLNGDIVTGNPLDETATAEAEWILSQPEYTANTYGKCTWLRTEQGSLWCVRDVYCQQPLRRVGKTAVRIREEKMANLGQSNQQYGCTIFFFDSDGTWLMSAGRALSDKIALQASALGNGTADTLQTSGGEFIVSVYRQGGWWAAGLLPMGAVTRVRQSVVRIGLIAALVGILVGLALSTGVSHHLSGQVRRLVQSMNRVADGDLTVEIPVESSDDLGVLTENFNRMTRKTKDLFDRVVQEEANKQRAEYQNLEYEYRFLQWQINPHFIYNALETVNALAKLDDNTELSNIILQLSAYFRANAEAMSQKFVTVRQEFHSVEQYVNIYRGIYGSSLKAEFRIAPGVEEALVPTMILQPIMENALIHGNRGRSQNGISADAEIVEDGLRICIRDNGPGMTAEAVHRILHPDEGDGRNERTSLGVRNVLERMRLLYGDSATMEIDSRPGEGTCVQLCLPCVYSGNGLPESGQKTEKKQIVS